MKDNSYLFRIDPAASAAYNMYKASNNNNGSFLDFLLKYDTNKANSGDFSSVLGDSENAKVLNYLIKDSFVKPENLTNAIQNLKSEKDKDIGALIGSTTYDMLSQRSDEMVNGIINSSNLTAKQKQLLAQKYKELSEN